MYAYMYLGISTPSLPELNKTELKFPMAGSTLKKVEIDDNDA